jgi:dihydroxy-acid dehydratase
MLEDFDRVSKRTPHVGDLKPFGRYHMVDLDRIGGVPVVLRALYDEGLIHGGALTVTGKTMAENLEGVRFPEEQDVVRLFAEPVAEEGGIAMSRSPDSTSMCSRERPECSMMSSTRSRRSGPMTCIRETSS